MGTFFVFTLSDVVGLLVFLLVLLIVVILAAVTGFTQWRCKHDKGVRETPACDAICRKCGKNLGFIGNIAAKLRES
jgi:amino acid permease